MSQDIYRLPSTSLFTSEALSASDPRVELRIGIVLVGLFVFGFLGWSALARLDSAVNAQGFVRVSGNRQSVQTLQGGIVSAIHVHEGDRVKAGQVLIEFGTTEILAQERSLASRVLRLQAEIARINAEDLGNRDVVAPSEWTALPEENRAEAASALANEQANLNAARTLLSAERAVLQQRIAQTSSQITGYQERQASNKRQGDLNKDELDSVEDLYRQGLATKNRVLTLERSAASIDGDIGETMSEVGRLKSTAGEYRLQMMQLADQRRQDNSDRLRTAETELQSLTPQWKAAVEQLGQSRVKAPLSGTVLGLTTNTINGVAAPGQKLMEIVPAAGTLVVEAQLSLADANDIRSGQKAEVRLTSLRGRNLLPLHGTVSRVSADSIIDEHTGRSFFTATVSVPGAELRRAEIEAGIGGGVKPGTPVSVVIPLKARTALQYWIGPLTERIRPAMTER